MGIDNRGSKNPMYGRKHSEETKRKIAATRKKYTMENHPSWKGGKRVSANGYLEVRIPSHHRARANGYVFEHIIVAEEKIGRKLEPNETVHHINKNRQDNRPDNLEVIDRAEHSQLHGEEREHTGQMLTCPVCGSEFYSKPSHVHKRKYCSKKCHGSTSGIGELNKKVTDEQIVNALKDSKNVKEAASKLGVGFSAVYRRMKKIGDVS